MAEKVLENPVCESCGVDVRPQAMFCYNCGSSVETDGAAENFVDDSKNGGAEISSAWLSEDFASKEPVKDSSSEYRNNEQNAEKAEAETAGGAETAEKAEETREIEESKIKDEKSAEAEEKAEETAENIGAETDETETPGDIAETKASANGGAAPTKEKTSEKTGIQENAKLKSAAAMRRKAKSYQAQKVEVVWEEPESFLSIKLIIVALLLTIFAAGIVYFALRMK